MFLNTIILRLEGSLLLEINNYQTRTGFTVAPVFISASASWNLSICENSKSVISKLNGWVSSYRIQLDQLLNRELALSVPFNHLGDILKESAILLY